MSSNNEEQQQHQLSADYRTMTLSRINYSLIPKETGKRERITIYELKEFEFPIDKISYNANLIYEKYIEHSKLSRYAAIWYDIFHHENGAYDLSLDISDNNDVNLPMFIVSIPTSGTKYQAVCCINQLSYGFQDEDLRNMAIDMKNIFRPSIADEPTTIMYYYLCIVVYKNEDHQNSNLITKLWANLENEDTFENVSLKILFSSTYVDSPFSQSINHRLSNFEILKYNKKDNSSFTDLSSVACKVRNGSKVAESALAESLAAQFTAHWYGASLAAVERDLDTNYGEAHFIVKIPSVGCVACNVFRFRNSNKENQLLRLYTNMEDLKKEITALTTRMQELSNQIINGENYTARIIWIIFDEKQKWKDLKDLHEKNIPKNANIYCKFIFTKMQNIWDLPKVNEKGGN